MRRNRQIRNIRRLLSTVLAVVLLAGCGRPEPSPTDPLELELAGLTVHERAALTVAAALRSGEGGGADQLRAELATGAAGTVLIPRSQLLGAAALLDSLRANAPLPIMVIVDLGDELLDPRPCSSEGGSPGQAGCRPRPAAPSPTPGMTQWAPGNGAAGAEDVARAAEEAGGAVFAAGGDLALLALPPINRDDPLPSRVLTGVAGAARTRSYLEGLRRADLQVAVRALAAGDTLSAALRWDRARLEAIELPVLERVVATELAAIEVGGVRLPSLAGDSLPLPLSPAVARGLMRRDLGFEGVVMANLSAGSLAARERGMPAAAVDALAAGVDLLLGVEAPAATVDAIAAAVATGRLAPARLEEAARRVLRLRLVAGLDDSLRLERRRSVGAELASAAAARLSQGRPAEAAGPPPSDSAATVAASAGNGGAGSSAEGLVAASSGTPPSARSAPGKEDGSDRARASTATAGVEGDRGVGNEPPAPPAPMLRVVPPDSAGMATAVRTRIDAIMREALADSVFSGAAVAVGRRGGLVVLRGYGRNGRAGEGDAVDPRSTIFDIASLTKVIGTTTAAALLVEDGRLDLDAPLARYLPEFDGDGKGDVLIRHLLSHTSGLPSGIWVFGSAGSPEEALRQILELPLLREPGARMEYSDLGMILLAEAVERVAEMPIDRFLARRVFAPLGMQSTMYLPPLLLHDGIVPTAEITERDFPLQGIVHDANSFRLGGIAGHAGLFSTARDLAVFAQMMLNGGRYGDLSILSPQTVATFTRRQADAGQRALGWDTPSRVSSAGAYFSSRSFGHTGYTGTSLWMDPQSGLFVVLLTNRTYVKASARDILRLRAAVHDAAARAITDQRVRRR